MSMFHFRDIVPCAVVALLASMPSAGASLPFEGLDDIRGPYEGVGAMGEVLYVCPLGNAGGWPIRAYWSSAHLRRSPLFGFGWCVPALESTFVPLDERRWVFHQPDGFARVFVRVSRNNPNELSGGLAWRATIRGDAIRVTADPRDGGPKSEFTFSEGRLVKMSCEEGDFEIRYEGRVASRILSKGRTVFDILRKDGAMLLKFNDGRATATAKCRPVTLFAEPEAAESQTPVQESCLVELTAADGRRFKFTYGGEPQAAAFAANGTEWRWNPGTRKVMSQGDWIYMVGDAQNEWDEPSISRGRKNGEQERHHYDRKNGLRTQKFPDGREREVKMFTSGPLAWRKARWMRETFADGREVRTDFAYDEAGRMFYRRTTDKGRNGDTEEMWFDAKGAPVRRKLNGEELPLK